RVGELRHASQVAAGSVQRCDQPSIDRVASDDEHDRYVRSCGLCCQRRRIIGGVQCSDRLANENPRHTGQATGMAFGPTVIACDGVAFNIAESRKPFAEGSYKWPIILARSLVKEANRGSCRLLRARRERPCSSRAADERNELAAPDHSITSS